MRSSFRSIPPSPLLLSSLGLVLLLGFPLGSLLPVLLRPVCPGPPGAVGSPFVAPAAAQIRLEAGPFAVPSPVIAPDAGLVAGDPRGTDLGDGAFFLTWTVAQLDELGPDRVTSIVGRRVEADGVAAPGRIFAVQARTNRFLAVAEPAVAASGAGEPVVTWNAFLDVFDAVGRFPVPPGTSALIEASRTTAALSPPAVAAVPGASVVVWEVQEPPPETPTPFPGRAEILAQAFDPEGRPLGEARRLQSWEATGPLTDLSRPAVVATPGAPGAFLAAWRAPAPDGSGPTSWIQALGRSGVPLGPPVALAPPEPWRLVGAPALAWQPDRGVRPGTLVVVAAAFDASGPDGTDGVDGADPVALLPLVAARYRLDGRPVASVIDGEGTAAVEVEAGIDGLGAPTLAADRLGNLALLRPSGGEAVLSLLDGELVSQIPPFPLGAAPRPAGLPVGALAVAEDRLLVAVPRFAGLPGRIQEPGDVAGAVVRLLRDDDRCRIEGNRLRCRVASSGSGGDLAEAFGRVGEPRQLADVDGDGRDDQCLRRGNRLLCDTLHDGGLAEWSLSFGRRDDRVLLGDVDGDGRDEPCLRRGRRFLCDTAGDGGTAERVIFLGSPDDVALLGDVDGDGRDDPCVHGPSTGAPGLFRCRLEGAEGARLLLLDLGQATATLSGPATGVFVADPDGDGVDGPCVLGPRVLGLEDSLERLICGQFGPDGGALESLFLRDDPPRPGPLLLGDLDGF